jgi:hypothetical protein
MQLRDGMKVSYIGLGEAGVELGDRGTVLSADTSGSHVSWVTGAAIGRVILVHNDDLAPISSTRTAVHDELDDSLEYGSLVSIAAREIFDASGEAGLMDAMNEAGHLASLTSSAEDAVAHVAAQVRNSPSFESVLAQLDSEEADSLVNLTASSLIKDALGE